jgi:hypothetical protein
MKPSFFTTILLALPLGLAACGGQVTFGGTTSTSGGSGGSGDGGTSSVSTSASSSGGGGLPGTTTTTSTGSSGGVCSGPNTPMPVGACVPQDLDCQTQSSICAASETYAGAPQFALRVTQVTPSAPHALSTGVGKSGLENALGAPPPACDVKSGMQGWALRFDQAAGTVIFGGVQASFAAEPVFSFLDQTLPSGGGSVHFAPLTLSASIDASCGFTSASGDIDLPLFLQEASPIYLPLRALRIHDAAVSPDHNCIGAYNAQTLDTGNGCLPTAESPAFTNGATMEAFIPLEAADQVMVTILQRSLCAFLVESPAYTDEGSPAKCKRDASGAIVFQGDWCSATNQPAEPGCADAMHFSAGFAAAGAKLQ